MAYSVTITESSIDLTPKQRVMYKDFSDAVKLDIGLDSDEGVIIYPDFYVQCRVENDKARRDKEYDVLLIIDKAGTKYRTGSPTFIENFKAIFEDMKEVSEEWGLRVYGLPSRNFEGKSFLTCSVV